MPPSPSPDVPVCVVCTYMVAVCVWSTNCQTHILSHTHTVTHTYCHTHILSPMQCYSRVLTSFNNMVWVVGFRLALGFSLACQRHVMTWWRCRAGSRHRCRRCAHPSLRSTRRTAGWRTPRYPPLPALTHTYAAPRSPPVSLSPFPPHT